MNGVLGKHAACRYLASKIITMAIQKGLIKFTGSVGDFSGYEKEGIFYLRTKGGGTKEHINNSPACARTREGNAEMEHASQLSTKFRKSIYAHLPKVKFNRLHNRLTDLFFDMIFSDTINDRGKRKAYKGDMQLLSGFNINKFLPLEHTYFGKLKHQFSTDNKSVMVNMEFNPISDVKAPKGTTHLEIKSILSLVPVEDGLPIYSIASDTVLIPHENLYAEPDFAISIPALAGEYILMHLIQIKYVQQLNNSFYDINEKGGKVLAVLEAKMFK